MFFKSNSVLVGFDKSSIAKANEFNFLNFIQNASIDVSAQRIYSNPIGSSKSTSSQFTFPNVNINLSYLQRVDLFNEFLFGFNIVSAASTTPFVHKFKNGFLNKNCFFLVHETEGVDILNEIRLKSLFSSLIKVISFNNIYLNKYSISYAIGSAPIVNANFLASKMNIGNVQNDTNFYFLNPEGDRFNLDFSKATDLFRQTNENQRENIVYHMQNFSFSNTFDANIPGIQVNTLLNGVIQSLELNLEFERNKFWFFSKNYEDQKMILPLKGNLKFSGISSVLINENLNSFFQNDKEFNTTISLGKDVSGKDFYQIQINNLKIVSFNYSIDVNGMLNYSMDCYFEVYETGGAIIRQIKDKLGGTDPVSSNGDFIISSDGSSVTTFSQSNSETPIIDPDITLEVL